jgi:poly(beta-D-mannuronate) lyase
MKPFVPLIVLLSLVCLSSCSASKFVKDHVVGDIQEFEDAVKIVQPGDRIVLANGIWKDTELLFIGEGTEEKPITLTVETKGKVFLEGQSNLRMGGKYLIVEGLVFRNGYTPTGAVISMRKDKKLLCNNCRVTECVIDDYNPSERFDSDYWVAMYGKNNRFDHNYLVGKRNLGVTLAVRLDRS